MHGELHGELLHMLIAAIGIAIIAGPLGCFIVWQRMAYFGDSLAHTALLGVALGIFLNIDITLGVGIICLVFAILLTSLQSRGKIAADTSLAILAHGGLAMGLFALSFKFDEHDGHELLHDYLLGHIDDVSTNQILSIYIGGALCILALSFIWRRLLSVTINEELAFAEGVKTTLTRLIFVITMAVFVAISMQIIGILLLTSLLIFPAATARNIANSAKKMAIFASIIGIINVFLGLYAADIWHTPASPTIVLVAAGSFLLILLTTKIFKISN